MNTDSKVAMKGMQARGYVYAALAVIIWSGFILASRQGGLSVLTTYDVIAIRYGVCTLLILPLLPFVKVDIRSYRLWVVSIIGALLYALFTFHGFQFVPASQAALLLPGLIPVCVSIAGLVLFKQALSPLKWTGLFMITISVCILLANTHFDQGTSLDGYVAIMLGAVCWSVYTLLIRRWEIEPWSAICSLAVMTCLLYLPVYILLLPKNLSSAPWPEIALQAFYQGFLATIVQMWLYVRATYLIGPQSMGAMMSLVPLLAGGTGSLIFDEPLSLSFLLALGLVSLGLYLNQVPRLPFNLHTKEI